MEGIDRHLTKISGLEHCIGIFHPAISNGRRPDTTNNFAEV